MGKSERWLKIVLWATGGGCAIGALALYMPRAWMVWGHQALGMGPFPEGPLAEYLSRLTSGLYGLFGLLVLFMAHDVRRYEKLISAQALLLAILACSASFQSWGQGVPAWWLAGDALSTTLYAAAVWFLQYRVKKEDHKPETQA